MSELYGTEALSQVYYSLHSLLEAAHQLNLTIPLQACYDDGASQPSAHPSRQLLSLTRFLPLTHYLQPATSWATYLRNRQHITPNAALLASPRSTGSSTASTLTIVRTTLFALGFHIFFLSPFTSFSLPLQPSHTDVDKHCRHTLRADDRHVYHKGNTEAAEQLFSGLGMYGRMVRYTTAARFKALTLILLHGK